MAKKVTFSKEDEEFFGKNGSFGVPKFDLEMNGGSSWFHYYCIHGYGFRC